jgi:glycosyltransferase involved in cell wall biosynthesis
MRILHIYKDYYPVIGGMENHIKFLAEAQVRLGHEVSVLVTHPTAKTHKENINGVNVIKAGRIATIASSPVSLALPLLLRKERPHIAHLHFPYPIGEVSQLFFGRAARIVLTYQSDVVRQRKLLRLYLPLMKLMLNKVDRIIATSENYLQSSNYLVQLRHKCSIIPLGIELSPFLHVDKNEVERIRTTYTAPLLLFVGKLRYYKGLQYLLEAMKDVPAKLLVIGSGPMEEEWRRLAMSFNVFNKVIFLGELGDAKLPPFYHASDIFVLPSSERSEAFGLVQIEAMASGKPVVSTELRTGTSFVNKHGETGLVVPPRDSRALRNALGTLLENETLRLAMGARGRQRAEKEFSLQIMVDRVMYLYSELTGL